MTAKINWLSKQDIVDIHEKVLTSTEPVGFHNEANLDSLLHTLEAYLFSESLYNIAGLLLWKLTQLHCFQQGNKRTAVVSAVTFLNLNAVDVVYEYSGSESDPLYQLTIAIAKGEIADEDVGKYLAESINSFFSGEFPTIS